jgi:FKBP-type peptidyl-prolyl cis-trans isomerase
MKSTTFLLLPAICITLILSSGCQESTDLGGNSEFTNNLDSISYSLGYFYGSSLANEGIDEFNYSNFLAGLQQAVEQQDPELDDNEMQIALQNFQMELQQRMDADREASAAENIAEGSRFLEENAGRDDVNVTDSGLQYRVIEEGNGVSPTEESTVRVHYRGTLINGEEFDSSYERGEPAEFPLNRVITGWTEGLQLMQVGSKYEFFIPSELGYGNTPPPGSVIEPGSVLIFEVELLEVVD